MLAKPLFAIALTVGGTLGTGVAHADTGDTLAQLESWGYNVMLNGVQRDVRYLEERQKHECFVTAVHPSVSGPLAPGEFQTVYVDLSCPSSDNSNTPGGGT